MESWLLDPAARENEWRFVFWSADMVNPAWKDTCVAYKMHGMTSFDIEKLKLALIMRTCPQCSCDWRASGLPCRCLRYAGQHRVG
jgi:hypothetical protein